MEKFVSLRVYGEIVYCPNVCLRETTTFLQTELSQTCPTGCATFGYVCWIICSASLSALAPSRRKGEARTAKSAGDRSAMT
jgi:hypothetical protein